jgi:uncharacterized membrane protein YtjA (UPF0391 family)
VHRNGRLLGGSHSHKWFAANRLEVHIREWHNLSQRASQIHVSARMVSWVLTLLIVAILIAVFGFSDTAERRRGGVKLLFFALLVVIILSLFLS